MGASYSAKIMRQTVTSESLFVATGKHPQVLLGRTLSAKVTRLRMYVQKTCKICKVIERYRDYPFSKDEMDMAYREYPSKLRFSKKDVLENFSSDSYILVSEIKGTSVLPTHEPFLYHGQFCYQGKQTRVLQETLKEIVPTEEDRLSFNECKQSVDETMAEFRVLAKELQEKYEKESENSRTTWWLTRPVAETILSPCEDLPNPFSWEDPEPRHTEVSGYR